MEEGKRQYNDLKITPVLLAGGMGVRLRPLTGKKSPKPFLKLLSDYSLFQETVLRSKRYGDPVVMCYEASLQIVQEQLAEINVKPRAIMLEPDYKGTAAAIALGAFFLKNQGETMLVLPTDHYLDGQKAFEEAVERAARLAKEAGAVVTIGVKPDRAETGYGYVERGAETDISGVYALNGFTEKPSIHMARKYVSGGRHVWHTGIFLCTPKHYLDLLSVNQQEVYKLVERSFYSGFLSRNKVYSPGAVDFFKIRPVSVDYAVMEHLKSGYISVLDAQWSDVGTWPQVIRQKFKSILKLA